ncbi:hypothetical protein GTU79_01430 [Sodalis ligni]|uniref:hypothetical protein n=1 Tax=Sodalis ligni TaxID=2697027 RepID=UPI00193EFA03|nr:hypothetical protein [Sodalis ligni]QWA11516.1 hypothetical protein GTU79_01430 [Sodalis ligni]
MAMILNQTHPLLSITFSSTTDFTELAGYCERFAETLLESSDPRLRHALCERLSDCLALLYPTLDDPIPSHVMDRLTVDELPLTSPRFEPDSDLLCEYCQVLVQLLTERAVSPQREKILTGLLFDLTSYFAEELKAPRWIRTADGVKFIAEVEVARER